MLLCFNLKLNLNTGLDASHPLGQIDTWSLVRRGQKHQLLPTSLTSADPTLSSSASLPSLPLKSPPGMPGGCSRKRPNYVLNFLFYYVNFCGLKKRPTILKKFKKISRPTDFKKRPNLLFSPLKANLTTLVSSSSPPAPPALRLPPFFSKRLPSAVFISNL